MKNYDFAVELYNNGLSIQGVADKCGVTRQAMWESLKVRGVKFRPQRRSGSENTFYRGGAIASDKSHNKLEKAIIRGEIKSKDVCENCGYKGKFKNGRSAIQAHHSDYNKPLDVIWLCKKCHFDWHKNNKAIERREDATR